MDIHQHELSNALPKQKRIKVSKACHLCRIKKIKCDGLIPCMQCKARQRPCSFAADGVGDPNYPIPSSIQSPTTITPGNSSSPPSLPPRQPISAMNYTTSATSPNITYEQQLLDSTTHRLETLGQSWPGCEYEDVKVVNSNAFNGWPYQQQKQQQRAIAPPPLSLFLIDLSSEPQDNYNDGKYNTLVGRMIVSPESNIQHNLITTYYHHRYRLLPLLPKSTLLTLIHRPSPQASISPLLLCTLYAHAAQSSTTTSSDADHYATTAKSMLNDYMAAPQLSTVIALVLLSLYESNRHGYSCSPCQASIYSAMAFRMCLDLNLYNCINLSLNDQPIIKALKLRVFWCCYCLDKWQSLCTDRPPMLHHVNVDKNMDLDGEMILSMEGSTLDQNEQVAMEGLVASTNLAQLGERLLQQPPSSTGFYADQQLLPFLQRLPASLHWTPLPTPESLSSPTSSLYQPIPSHPPHNAIVGQFHLTFNLLHLTLLVRSLLEMQAVSSSNQQPDYGQCKDNEQMALILQRCATVATNLTQLTCALTDQTGFILWYRMVAHAVMMSVRVHLIQCYSVMQPTGNEQHRVAKHARLMFQRSLRSLRILVQHRVIPGADTFATSVEKTLATLTLTPQGNSDYTSINHSNSNYNSTSSMNKSPQQQGLRASLSSSNQHQLQQHQQRSDYLSGAEQNAAQVLLNTFNVNNDSNTTKSLTTSEQAQSSSGSSSYTAQATSQQEKQQQQEPLVDVASLYTSATSNPLYHQQIQPHFGYSLPAAKLDEVWALQEHYQLQQQQRQQQQQQQQKYQPTISSPSSSSTQSYNTTTTYSSSLWVSSSSSSTTAHIEKKAQGTLTTSAPLSSSPSKWPSTRPSVPASSSTSLSSSSSSSSTSSTSSSSLSSSSSSSSSLPSSTSLGKASSTPNKSFGLGVYASAHRHHSDVIGQHYSKNETSTGTGNGNKLGHRPVILNHHGQVLVASSTEPPSA